MVLLFSNQTVIGNYKLSINSTVHDLQGNHLAPYTTTVPLTGVKTYTNSTATAIKPGTLTASTITVPAGTTIGSLQVKINATYPVDGELYFYLIAPNGKTVALVNNRGGTGANFQNTVFSEAASTAITSAKAPFAGTYRPESSLSLLNGLNAAGSWRLMVKDSGGHSGTLLNWSLIITPAAGSTSSVSVRSAGSEAATVSSSSALVSHSSPAGTSTAPRISGQRTGDENFSAMLDALLSAQRKSAPTPPAPVDHVFASPVVMAQMQTNLLVGKRSSNNPNG
jgi:subtilisin-like proprotein convertase family protein